MTRPADAPDASGAEFGELVEKLHREKYPAPSIAKVPVKKAKTVAGVVATPFAWRDPTTISPRQWLFGRHAIRGFVSSTAAAGGLGKTALALVEAAAFVTGRDLLGDHLHTSGRAWYIGLEDPLEEYERRVAALAIHYGLGKGDLVGGLFLDSGRDQSFIVAHEYRGGVQIAEPVVASIIANIIANEISYVVVDPFVACHRVDESANTKIETVARLWARVAQETNTAVELVHHLRKGTVGQEPSADDVRGASALVNAARSVRVLASMTKEEAENAGVDERRRYLRVTPVKANLTLPSDVATWRQLVSVPLGNGNGGPDDIIGVAAAWSWPSAFDGMTPADLRRVQTKIAGGEWRESSQAEDWAGKAVAEVMGLDLAEASAKTRIKSMLKTWIGNNALKIVTRKNDARQPKTFIEVGEWAT
jgi:hypothetical protein